MKQIRLSIFLLFWAFCAPAQSDNSITIGVTDSIYSNILGEPRKVWVYVPNSDARGIFAQRRYPVVYLLDGDAHFFSVVGMIQQLSSVNGNTLCPEMIVVGIPNTDRTRDLTPTHVDRDPPFVNGNFGRTSGGGENFIAFMEKELMPHIESRYPTEPYRMFIGHSFGGLAVINALIHHTDLFNAYVAIDPSMWWDHEKLLGQSKEVLSSKKFSGKSLFLGIANTLPDGMSLKEGKADESADTRHIRSIFELDKLLDKNKKNQLKYETKYYGDDDHGSVSLIAEYDALHFIFDFYRLKLTQKDYADTTMALVHKLEKHYADMSRKMGYQVKPPENQVNNLGYQALINKHFRRAEYFFKSNVANYPESANVYDSYGDYFVAKGDTANAILYFQKSLAVQETLASREKLEALQGVQILQLKPEVLQNYAATFDFNGTAVTTTVKNGALWMQVPGQPEYELQPVKAHGFKIKSLAGYSVLFEMENGKLVGAYSVQPDGTFKATVKK